MATFEIRTALSDEDYQAFAGLITQYVEWCRIRYQDDVWFITEVFGHQSLDHEIVDLAHAYGPPHGMTFLAYSGPEVCGGGAYRRLADGRCEMKRLFVADEFHGMGIGGALCQTMIDSARNAGFNTMCLDTATRLTEAIALYQRHGFKQCAPYYQYPANLQPYLLFMERRLNAADKVD